jgi:PAS domain S-box-containing protein
MRDAEGVVTHFVAVEEDVTERRWAEEAIRDREEQLRQIADNIHEVFYVVDADFQETLFISPAYEEVWGRTVRSMYEDPRSFMAGIHEDDRPAVLGNVTRMRAGESPGAVEFRVVQPSGELRWARGHASPVLDERGEVYRIAGVALDITDRKHAEDRLRESEERYRKLTDASFDAIVVTVEG